MLREVKQAEATAAAVAKEAEAALDKAREKATAANNKVRAAEAAKAEIEAEAEAKRLRAELAASLPEAIEQAAAAVKVVEAAEALQQAKAAVVKEAEAEALSINHLYTRMRRIFTLAALLDKPGDAAAALEFELEMRTATDDKGYDLPQGGIVFPLALYDRAEAEADFWIAELAISVEKTGRMAAATYYRETANPTPPFMTATQSVRRAQRFQVQAERDRVEAVEFMEARDAAKSENG